MLFSRLKTALECLLNYYLHLTGVRHMNTQDNLPIVNNLGSGAKLIEAVCSEILLETPSLQFTDLPHGGNLLVIESKSSIKKLLPVQYTKFACGSVAVGAHILHIA
ncbi:hypothetical protein HK100_007062 [Physocladia obscura]|uniref:Uncharacterized protein n=1 Tax=Physocladia obscura TaxID=109957 RepID=A0AAD5SS41_9FUNG|nr:hypothetical protein HK100_007062 [Physocladia obscura]